MIMIRLMVEQVFVEVLVGLKLKIRRFVWLTRLVSLLWLENLAISTN